MLDTIENYTKQNHPVCFIGITLSLQLTATTLSILLYNFSPVNTPSISLIYILSIYLTACLTRGYIYGTIAALTGVICVNYLFTYPFFELNFSLAGYPTTFIIMMVISLLTSTLTIRLKSQAEHIEMTNKKLFAAEKTRMKTLLFNSVSHNLKTPLTAIIGNATALSNLLDLAEPNSTFHCKWECNMNMQRELISNVLENANQLSNQIDNILSIIHIQTNSTELNYTLESVEEVIEDAITGIKKRYPNVDIEFRFPEEVYFVPMDVYLIKLVLQHFLENSIKYSNPNEIISCFVTDTEKSVTIYVKDHGDGIPTKLLPDLFEDHFYTDREYTIHHKSLGVGLSICKDIILAHHGSIGAHNHEFGAIFYFTLPKEREENV